MINPNNNYKLSQYAKDMINRQYGFRTDAQSAVSITEVSPKEILNYELNTLQNPDIADTMNDLYHTNFTWDENDNYNIDQIDTKIRELLRIKTNESYYLIWLVSEWQQCFTFYSDGHITPQSPYDHAKGFDMPFIDTYQVHADDVLVSDCGIDGQLIATKYLPKPMHGFNH